MGLVASATSPPSGWPGSLTTMFRFSAARLPSPPKPLDSSPRWVSPILVLRLEAASVVLGARSSRWAGAGIADMDEVVRQGKKKALVLLCSRLAAANTSTSRSVALSSIFETQLHVFRSRIPLPHPQRALPLYGTPSTGTLCSVSWPTADLPRSVLGSSAHSWCRARSLRERPFAPSTHMPLIGQAAAEPQRETRGGTYLNAMSPLFQFHGPLGSPLPLLLLSALVRPGWRGCCLPSHRTPPGLGTWSRPPCRIKLPWLLYANRPPGERRLWSPPQVVLFVAAHLQTDATPKLASHLQRPFPPT